jgi:hypothetical protein
VGGLFALGADLDKALEQPHLDLAWPAAEASLEALSAKAPLTLVKGLPASSKAFYLAWVYRRLAQRAPWLILTPTREECLALRDDLTGWLPGVPVLACPSWEVLPWTPRAPTWNWWGTLAGVPPSPGGDAGDRGGAPGGGLQSSIAPDDFLSALTRLRREEDCLPTGRNDWSPWVRAVTQVTMPGQFAVRGGIVDIASPGPRGRGRLDLFGDTLTSLRALDLTSQRSAGELEEAYLYPAHEALWTKTLRRDLGRSLEERASQGFPWAQSRPTFSAAWGLPGMALQVLGLRERQTSLLDFLPDDARVVLGIPRVWRGKPRTFTPAWKGSSPNRRRRGATSRPSTACSNRPSRGGASPRRVRVRGGQLEQTWGDGPLRPFSRRGPRLCPATRASSRPSPPISKVAQGGQAVLLWCHNGASGTG